MAEAKRETGVVTRFFKKGYGFIKPNDGGEDLFFHYQDINSDEGFRILHRDQEVEFIITFGEDGRTKAVDVTPPGGGKFDSSHRKKRVNRGARRSNVNGSVNGGGGVECFRCGGRGHRESVCPSERLVDGGCYTCGDPRHFARDCQSGGGGGRAGGGGGDGRGCYICEDPGHFARDCPGEKQGGRGGGRGCYICEDPGHFARNCPREKQGGGGGRDCYNCGGPGHFARECTSGGGEGGRGAGGRGGNVQETRQCRGCGKIGHIKRECKEEAA